jgi:hypothetical protein
MRISPKVLGDFDGALLLKVCVGFGGDFFASFWY